MTKSCHFRLNTKLHRHDFGENIIEEFPHVQYGDQKYWFERN